MESLVLQTLLGKLRNLHVSGMSAAAAAWAAGGAGAPAAAAGGAGVQRGLRTAAAAASTVGGGAASTMLASVQQQQPQQPQRRLSMAAAPFVPRAASAAPAALAGPRGGVAALALHPAAAARQLGGGLAAAAPQPRHARHYASGAAAQLADADQEDGEAVGLGSLLEFERSREFLLGRATKQTPQGWQVETASGTLYSVRRSEVKFVLPGGPGRSAADLAAAEAAAAGEAAADSGLLQLAWELAGDSGAPLSVAAMADLLFNAAGAPACAAALRLLRADRLYFKQVGRSPPLFSARRAAEVESLLGSQRRAAEVEAARAAFAAAVAAARAAPRAQKPDEAAWRAGPHGAALAAVEGLALGALPLSGPERSLASQTLLDLGATPSAQDAAELLQAVGWWPPHVQLGLLAAGVSETFAPELEAAAAALLAAPPPDLDAGARADFTSHGVLTIDDAATTEIDDGLSAEPLPGGGVRVWVHIADPSRWVAPGTPLAAEAAARSKSAYLPTGTVPMFPRCLAEGPFSLRPGVATDAVSVGVELAPDGGLVPGSVRVVPSRVAPARRLTYDDVDGMLGACEREHEPELFALADAAGARRAHREARGATAITMPECRVVVRDPRSEQPAVEVAEEDQHASPAHQLVAEMMILAGEAVGELGRELRLPLPYRGQAQAVLPDAAELAAAPPGPCRAVLLRSRMTRSVTATHAPARHAGLGLDAYVQFTSPIRRYGDLLAHWQLKAALRGEAPPWDADGLAAVVDAAGAAAQRLSKLERESEGYWLAEYFRQAVSRDPRAAWDAMFLCWLKQEAGLGRVLLGGLGLEAVVRINCPMEPGERMFLRCAHVDVPAGMYRLEAVPPASVDAACLQNDSSHYAAAGSTAYSPPPPGAA